MSSRPASSSGRISSTPSTSWRACNPLGTWLLSLYGLLTVPIGFSVTAGSASMVSPEPPFAGRPSAEARRRRARAPRRRFRTPRTRSAPAATGLRSGSGRTRRAPGRRRGRTPTARRGGAQKPKPRDQHRNQRQEQPEVPLAVPGLAPAGGGGDDDPATSPGGGGQRVSGTIPRASASVAPALDGYQRRST